MGDKKRGRKRDEEFEKSADKKLEKVFKRCSLDERRQVERHSQTAKENEEARREKTDR